MHILAKSTLLDVGGVGRTNVCIFVKIPLQRRLFCTVTKRQHGSILHCLHNKQRFVNKEKAMR